MKLTTLNLQGFINWEKREPEIIEYLHKTNPDIVVFQEVVFIPTISPFNQAQLLNRQLGYLYEDSAVTRLQPSSHYEIYREGLATFSKHPIVKTDTIVLKKAPEDEHQRIVQLIDIVDRGQTIQIANVHFSLTDTIDFASAHLQETLDIIAARGEKRIIAGDFNINHLESLSDIWSADYEASTTFSYISYSAMHKRNDYVLVPKSYCLRHISTSSDALSDHRAVTAEIAI
jgi:endonuclease/exonuclease/phosphatase family metal-dependent hydrolase